jgi:hypothetical protein
MYVEYKVYKVVYIKLQFSSSTGMATLIDRPGLSFDFRTGLLYCKISYAQTLATRQDFRGVSNSLNDRRAFYVDYSNVTDLDTTYGIRVVWLTTWECRRRTPREIVRTSLGALSECHLGHDTEREC